MIEMFFSLESFMNVEKYVGFSNHLNRMVSKAVFVLFSAEYY